jgi:signal transduction histidine kinase
VPLPEYAPNRSELCVPLKVGERVIGVLNVESAEPNHFTLADQKLLQTLADQAAVALENARLHAETQRRAKELLALNNAGRAMASFLDLNAVLEQTMAEVKAMLEMEGVSVLLLDPTGDKLVFVAAASPSAEKMIGVSVPLTGSIAGWAMRERQPVLLGNAQLDTRFYNGIDAITGLATQSLLAVPLILKDDAIGVIEAINDAQGVFNQHDLEMLEALASWAVIAIENARLHTEMKRRAQQLLALHELDWIITASLRIDDVYHALARHTARLLHYDYMSIALLKADRIHLAFVAGKSSAKLPAGTSLPRQTSVTGWIATRGQPLLRHNITDDMRFAEDEQLAALGIRSGMVIPLRVKGEVFGAWNINSQQISAYTPDDLAIAGSMGDQLAIAIDNARLYEAEREQFRRLQQSQAQLVQVEKMAALGRLVASIAHEINNPIQAIQNALTLVEEELADLECPEKIHLYIGIAKSEFERIAAIVRRMRDFYRRSSPRQQTLSSDSVSVDSFYRLASKELQVVDLHTILDNVLQLAHKQLQHGGVKVKRAWADHPLMIQGSPDHLQQVFLNLTLNAFDAMAAQGGGTLAVRTMLDQAELSEDQPKPVARVEFSDTGPGMSPEVLSRIFEPLFTTKEHGSGFGLFTSYKIIEAHRGQITVKSEVGVGATFTILLPAEQISDN